MNNTGASRTGMRAATHSTRYYGNNIHNTALLLAVTPLTRHMLHHIPAAVEVIIDNGIPAVFREIDSRLGKLATGVIH